MEYSYADQLDLEWQCFVQKFLKSFSFQNNGKLYSFEEALEKTFSSGSSSEEESNYQDKELCEKCLVESLHYLLSRNVTPRPTQVQFLLKIAKYTLRDESCFINLRANSGLSSLMYLSRLLNNGFDKTTHILILELLESYLEHHSGVQIHKENKYWMYAFNLVFEENMDKDVLNVCYNMLTKLLEKIVIIDKDYCYKLIQLFAGSLLKTSQLVAIGTDGKEVECSKIAKEMKPNLLCLIEILERLFESYNTGVLTCIIDLKVDVASDTLSKITDDKSVRLILERIAIILSLFKFADLFDGIKTVNEDPLAVTGILRIVEAETDRGAFDLMLELYHHILRYLKSVLKKLPTFIFKGKEVDIEYEVIIFQLELVLMAMLKTDNSQFLTEINNDMVRLTHTSKLFQTLSLSTLRTGLKIKLCTELCPFHVHIDAVKWVIRSRHLYSKGNLGSALEWLVYAYEDTMRHLKLRTNKDSISDAELHAFIYEILDAILLFIKSYNLNWPDSVKILEVAHILDTGCSKCEWSIPMIIRGCELLQEIIARRLSPTMSLLIDSAEDIEGFIPALRRKCFTAEWEARKVALDVIHTIAISGNKSFPSFTTLLIDASIPSLVSTMALHDEDASVRATAFKCLHEIILMEKLDDVLPRSPFIEKVLDVLMSDAETIVKKEAIKLTQIIFCNQHKLEETLVMKAYKTLEHVALTSTEASVQFEALDFWRHVIKQHLLDQGWVDSKFPSVTFSKRIVCMTDEEVRKRVYKVLNRLSMIGCLNVLDRFYCIDRLDPEVKALLNVMTFRFNELFQKYLISPDQMLFDQEIENIPLIPDNSDYWPQNAESEQVIQDIVDITVSKMRFDDLYLLQDEDIYSIIDARCTIKNTDQAPALPAHQTNYRISPSEFVDFIYKRVAQPSSSAEGVDEHLEQLNTEEVRLCVDY